MRVAGLWDDQEEARFVADEVEAWQRRGGALNQAAVLVRAGVPEGSVVLDTKSSNSEEEAAFGLMLAKARGWKRVLVVSDPPHLRRLDLVWGRAFEGSGIEYVLVASRPRWWEPGRWWRNRKSAQFVLMEYIKLVYTLL